MAEKAAGSELADLLEQRQNLTDEILEEPNDVILYLRRALVYSDMGYPDLALGDTFRVGRLMAQMVIYDEEGASKQAYAALRRYAETIKAVRQAKAVPEVLHGVTLEQTVAESENGNFVFGTRQADLDRDLFDYDDLDDELVFSLCKMLAFIVNIRAYQIASFNLLLCGCLRSAYLDYDQGLHEDPGNKELLQIKALVETAGRQRLRQSGGSEADYNPFKLPNRGFARREVYPWNTHEPDRCSPASLAFLNEQLAKVAPKCEVRAVQLPVLAAQGSRESATASAKRSQLGIFAKEPIAAGEVAMRLALLIPFEISALSVVLSYWRDDIPAAAVCSASIVAYILLNIFAVKAYGEAEFWLSLGKLVLILILCCTDGKYISVDSTVSCHHCDAVFCGEECYERALVAYHPANCPWKRIAFLFEEWSPRDANEVLYLLLVTRVLHMAKRQNRHPLELKEVKYLWGDFVPAATNTHNAASLHHLDPYSPEVVAMATAGGYAPAAWSLPFNFDDNISTPLRLMEELGLYTNKNLAEMGVWVTNTLYAKLHGTASARNSRRDGPTDVAAVHPLWSLANHDCDPNVTWEWGRCMVLRANEERVQLAEDKAAGTTRPGGIAAGQEILNHYCDVELPVQLRREWVRGILGGTCMRQRCQNEAATERGETLATSCANPACTCSCHE
ncbi:hypothetical protein SEPCBS119000_001799 [Sporothrix epigloea]|uniref:SET domain-containing protein n=1 Tax=Sporothrix epigloea TaxID=1892477 RepID=A0ABP0DCP7_9PEZI